MLNRLLFDPQKNAILLILGIVGDEITTFLGLSAGYIESNPFVVKLIEQGLWGSFDLLLVILCLTPLIFFKEEEKLSSQILALVPLLVGITRLSACISNILLIM
jgi:hypothetical protein